MNDEDAEDMMREVARERAAPQPTPEPPCIICGLPELPAHSAAVTKRPQWHKFMAAPQGVGKLCRTSDSAAFTWFDQTMGKMTLNQLAVLLYAHRKELESWL